MRTSLTYHKHSRATTDSYSHFLTNPNVFSVVVIVVSRLVLGLAANQGCFILTVANMILPMCHIIIFYIFLPLSRTYLACEIHWEFAVVAIVVIVLCFTDNCR